MKSIPINMQNQSINQNKAAKSRKRRRPGKLINWKRLYEDHGQLQVATYYKTPVVAMQR